MKEGRLFLESLEKNARIFSRSAKSVVESAPELSGWLLDPLAQWTIDAYGEDAIDKAIDGYARYCLHVAKAQQAYESTSAFNPSALPEIVDTVYEDEGTMVPYMWAAILIYAFWPSMIRHLRLFRMFVDGIDNGGTLLELASGHGVMGLLAARSRSDIRVTGYDISSHAVAISHRLLAASKLEDRVSFSVKDALDLGAAGTAGTCQAVMAAMLAEHLESPDRLFRIVSHHLSKSGTAFVSTALESAQRDHVHEFRRESEPILLAENAGLRPTDLVCDGSEASKPTRFHPRALAMLLRHA